MHAPALTRKDYDSSPRKGSIHTQRQPKKDECLKEGDRFGRLVLVRTAALEDFRRLGRKVNGIRVIKNKHWLCLCDCGGETVGESHDILRGSIISCGCYGRELRKILIDKTEQPRILYREYAFRSSWELVFALFCEKNGAKYEYEPRWFPVMIEGKEFDYKPDFFLTDLNVYVEIKGRVHGNSVKKFRKFATELAKAYILFEDSIRAMLKVTLYKWTRRALVSLKNNIVDLRNSPKLVAELKEYIAPFEDVFKKLQSN